MSKKTVLCADSTCDLGDELRERYHVQYFPFHVILDGQTYSDGVDLVPDEIYRVYREKNILPKKSFSRIKILCILYNQTIAGPVRQSLPPRRSAAAL